MCGKEKWPGWQSRKTTSSLLPWAQQNYNYIPPASAGDVRDECSIPGSGRSPGVGNGNPLQYSCLEKSKDGGAWGATIHRITESDMTERARAHTHTHT